MGGEEELLVCNKKQQRTLYTPWYKDDKTGYLKENMGEQRSEGFWLEDYKNSEIYLQVEE